MSLGKRIECTDTVLIEDVFVFVFVLVLVCVFVVQFCSALSCVVEVVAVGSGLYWRKTWEKKTMKKWEVKGVEM